MTAPDSRDSVELLPCPGCGDTRTRVIGGPGKRGGPEYWTGCDCCRWRTWGNTEAEAIAAWNTRALPQQAGGEDAKDAARYRWIRQHFKATFHRSTSDYWLIQGEHKTPAAVFRDGMDLTLDAAIDAALNGGQDDNGESNV